MVYRTVSLATPDTAYRGLQNGAKALKAMCQTEAAAMASGTMSVRHLHLEVLQTLKSYEASFAGVPPGLAAYANEIAGGGNTTYTGGGAYDLTAETSTLLAAIVAAGDAIKDALPVDGNGVVLAAKVNADRTTTDETLTAAQLAAVKTALEAVDAAIE